MWNKKCNHLSFWQIYKIINFNVKFIDKEWRVFKCNKCNKKCVLSWKWYKEMKKNGFNKAAIYFLWLLPALILMYKVANLELNYLIAILLVIIYHFWAMCYIIDSPRLKITEK
jgi:hypothetical protein